MPSRPPAVGPRRQSTQSAAERDLQTAVHRWQRKACESQTSAIVFLPPQEPWSSLLAPLPETCHFRGNVRQHRVGVGCMPLLRPQTSTECSCNPRQIPPSYEAIKSVQRPVCRGLRTFLAIHEPVVFERSTRQASRLSNPKRAHTSATSGANQLSHRGLFPRLEPPRRC